MAEKPFNAKYPLNVTNDSHIQFFARQYSFVKAFTDTAGRVKKPTDWSCCLYAPGGIAEQYSYNWQNQATLALSNGAMAGGAKMLFDKMTGGGGTAKASTVAQSGMNTFPNEILIFEGANSRNFSVSLELVPRNKQEADAINAIIEGFKFYSQPEYNEASAGALMSYPHIFDLRIFTSIFKNASGRPSVSTNGKNIISYDDMALVDVSIVYSQNSGSLLSYVDGQPINATLTLSFTSIRPTMRKGAS